MFFAQDVARASVEHKSKVDEDAAAFEVAIKRRGDAVDSSAGGGTGVSLTTVVDAFTPAQVQCLGSLVPAQSYSRRAHVAACS